jgi:hypothetical protein
MVDPDDAARNFDLRYLKIMSLENFWNPDKDMFAAMLRIDKAPFSKCLEPFLKCPEHPIKAHSIQNARILGQLVRDGHVVALTRSVTMAGGPDINFSLVGRNRATTFTGLCSHHDETIFAPIEKNDPRLDDEEHLFLLAYRTAYRELHATMEAAAKAQRAHLNRVAQGLDPKDTPTPLGMFSVERMIISWMMWRYKAQLDLAYADKQFSILSHDVINIDVDQSSIAVSSLFPIGAIRVRNNDDILRIHLNVLPLQPTKTVIIFSYLHSDAGQARAVLSHILGSTSFHQRYELSRLILGRCDNFVLSPSYFDGWSPQKKETVRSYFIQTLFKDEAQQHPDLYLF